MFARILINAIAIAVATVVLKTLDLAYWYNPLSVRGIVTILGVGAIFGIVNAVIKPLFKVLTGCVVLLTFGVFLLVINAAMLWLTSWVSKELGLDWGLYSGWQPPLIGTVIVSAASFVATKFVGK
ncbi:MAG: phage holin family protein [Propionibacteriaceae bacterium]|jgi:putative membrane protein|nr:phage holin family protein [Propionibacteriaceae bacterium]